MLDHLTALGVPIVSEERGVIGGQVPPRGLWICLGVGRCAWAATRWPDGPASGVSAHDEALLVRAARLEGSASQQVFRALLAALARPGTMVDLPAVALADGTVPPALLVALALGDVDTTHAVIGHRIWSRVVAAATSSRAVDAADADLVAAVAAPSRDDLRSLRIGSADAPERGARLALAVDRFTTAAADAAVAIRLRGPGVDGE
jgi:alpha-D-ribose 1-methylphosphonate 5-triphosphate synthase subunit PhnH